MPRYSYGEQVKERVKQLLKALLDYASNEFDYDEIDTNYLSITFVWQTKTDLVVRTTLSALEALTARQLTKAQIREALSLLRDFLHILEDLRVSTRGSQDWHFKLKLWSRDKEQNLRQFDIEWEKFRPAKSGAQEENTSELAETIHTASLETLPYNNIPQTGVRKFVGREYELEKLHQLLQEDDQIAITAIAGMGGVGKTELAIQYAIQHMNDYSGGVCWLQASNHNEGEYIGQQIVEFARPQFVNFTLPDDFTLREKVTFCWQHWQQGDVLIVLDDVTDYTKIKPYLPPVSSRFKVLLTTRLQLGTSVKQLSLDVLTSDSALALLEALIGSERVKREQKVAENICKWLGYLPLGLELVGRYIYRKPDLSIAEMFFRLEKTRLEQYSLKKPSTEADITAKEGVKDAFNLSWDELNEEAQLLACLLGLFAKAQIPWQFVEQCLVHNIDPEPLEEIRDYHLKALHFIQDKGQGFYQLHPLIREFFRSKLVDIGKEKSDEIKKNFAKTLISIAKQNFSSIGNLNTTQKQAIYHLIEIGMSLLEWVDPIDISIPLIKVNDLYEEQKMYGYDIQEKDILGELFERFINQLLKISQNQVNNTIVVNLQLLFSKLDLQQYLYDHNEIEKCLSQILKLNNYLNEGINDFHAENLKNKDKSEVILSKMLGHIYYGKRDKYKEAIENMLEALKKVVYNYEKSDEEEKKIWRWYRIFLLDHIHNLINRHPYEQIQASELESEIAQLLPERLKKLENPPEPNDFPYLLRAAHYWGHRGNQITYKISSQIATHLNNFEKQQLEALKNQGIEYYACAVAFRVATFYLSFPNQNYLSVLLQEAPYLPNWFSSWKPKDLKSNRFVFEKFTSQAQAVGDIAHQYRGIATILIWSYSQTNDKQKAELILKEVSQVQKVYVHLWEQAKKQLVPGEKLLKYYLWIISINQLIELAEKFYRGEKLPKMEKIEADVKNKIADSNLSYERAEWEILKEVREYYSVISR